MICRRSRTLSGMTGAMMLTSALCWSPPATAVDPFIGQIQFFPYNFAPRNWAFCDGQLLPIASYSALFSLLGTTYGGDGRSTFALPDMRGRTPVHPGRGPGLPTYTWGQRGGEETVTLSTAQLPSHRHTLQGTDSLGDQNSPAGATLARDGRDKTYTNAAPDVNMDALSITHAGGGQAHNNMPPFVVLNCNIALIGLFPSRS